MLTVKIHSIKKQYILSDEDFWYIKDHLDQPLPVMSVTYDSIDGHLWGISIYKRTNGITDCISLFVDKDANNVAFTFEGSVYGG
jgi:hypothetical protein